MKADIDRGIHWQFIDEIYELQDPTFELLRSSTGREALHVFVDFLWKLRCRDKIRRDLVVQKITGNDMTKRLLSGGEDGFVHDAQLASKLGYRSSRVDRTQHPFPKATANGK